LRNNVDPDWHTRIPKYVSKKKVFYKLSELSEMEKEELEYEKEELENARLSRLANLAEKQISILDNNVESWNSMPGDVRDYILSDRYELISFLETFPEIYNYLPLELKKDKTIKKIYMDAYESKWVEGFGTCPDGPFVHYKNMPDDLKNNKAILSEYTKSICYLIMYGTSKDFDLDYEGIEDLIGNQKLHKSILDNTGYGSKIRKKLNSKWRQVLKEDPEEYENMPSLMQKDLKQLNPELQEFKEKRPT